KGNTVDPQALIDKYGADTVRLFTMFAAPPEQSLEWSDTAVEGAFRFLKRLWRFAAEQLARGAVAAVDKTRLTPAQVELRRQIHQTIAKVNDDIGRRYTFNTAIAAVMELTNSLTGFKDDSEQGRALLREGLETIAIMLSPIVPHITEALWAALGHADLVANARWPTVDEAALARSEIRLVVQIDGNKQADLTLAAGTPEALVKETALADPKVRRYLEGHAIKKLVVVPGRLVNIVTV
ncbi:MAG: class I tRNA ligase family protein, partial [Gammaproteobacteria bacterium]